jgi:hypothetical protein
MHNAIFATGFTVEKGALFSVADRGRFNFRQKLNKSTNGGNRPRHLRFIPNSSFLRDFFGKQ